MLYSTALVHNLPKATLLPTPPRYRTTQPPLHLFPRNSSLVTPHGDTFRYTGGFSDAPPTFYVRRKPLLPTPAQPLASTSPVISATRPTSAHRPYQGGFSDASTVRQRTRPQTARHIDQQLPPEIFSASKLHFTLIKCSHHLDQLSGTPPRTILRLRRTLETVLRPAFRNAAFEESSTALADSWASGAVANLRLHYEALQQSTFELLRSTHLEERNFELALSTATSWAKQQLGRKLSRSTLESASSAIRQLHSFPASVYHSSTPPPSSPPSVSPPQEDPPLVTVSTLPPPCPAPDEARPPPASPLALDPQSAATSSSPPPAPPRSFRVSPDTLLQHPPPSSSPVTLDSQTNSLPSENREFTPPSVVPDPLPSLTSFFSLPSPSSSRAPASSSSSLALSSDRDPSALRSSSSALPLPSLTIPPSSSALLLGDSNLSSFSHPSSTVFARSNGRLSNLRSLVQRLPSAQHIQKVFVFVSTLNKANRFITLTTSIKSLLSLCHQRFPSATLFVFAGGISNDFSTEQASTFRQLNFFLRSKAPSGCVVLSLPSPFDCVNDVWSQDTSQSIYSKLSQYLN